MNRLGVLLLAASIGHAETVDQAVAVATAKAKVSWQKKQDRKAITDKVRAKYKLKLDAIHEQQRTEITEALACNGDKACMSKLGL